MITGAGGYTNTQLFRELVVWKIDLFVSSKVH
jgi:hypothetical protein